MEDQKKIEDFLIKNGVDSFNFRATEAGSRVYLNTPLVFNGNTCDLLIKYNLKNNDLFQEGEMFLTEPDDFSEQRNYQGETEFFSLLKKKIKRTKFKKAFSPGDYLFTQIFVKEMARTLKREKSLKQVNEEHVISVLMNKLGFEKKEGMEIFLEEKTAEFVTEQENEFFVIRGIWDSIDDQKNTKISLEELL